MSNTNPDEILDALKRLATRVEAHPDEARVDDAVQLARLVSALDAHLANGRPLPRRWWDKRCLVQAQVTPAPAGRS